MSLESWAEYRWLKKHRTSPQEIQELLGIVERDLRECQIETLSADTRHNIAYNAALQAAMASLAAAGYKPERGRHHYIAIQSLKFTIGLDSNSINLLDTFRGKRATSDYDRSGTISDGDAQACFEVAADLADKVRDWLHRHHSHLLK
jgi:hypothetical protein